MPARPRPRVHHSIKEKLHLRRHKRKQGPSAVRRRERRAPLQRTIDANISNDAISITEGDPA